MRIEVDPARCTGHGICETIAPDVFEVNDDRRVHIHGEHRPASDRVRLQQSVTQCPTAALTLTED
ncbi:MAG TPA: ferredoxin [Mycobacterium sp.]|nr:ferredoxin [Mycobacterium sp.]